MIEQFLQFDIDPAQYPITDQLQKLTVTALTDATLTAEQRTDHLMFAAALAILGLESRITALAAQYVASRNAAVTSIVSLEHRLRAAGYQFDEGGHPEPGSDPR